MSDRTARAQRVEVLRRALRENLGEEDDGVTVLLASADAGITTTDLTEDYVHEYRATWMPPPHDDEPIDE
ncbi:hypothetical protein [Terrabacter sp. NPDC000476]|uniref:hypothetical protein n=1 Tax=Terrabacter sp. NPDC000476 TaxID=3154258 RepID=UPI0033185D46